MLVMSFEIGRLEAGRMAWGSDRKEKDNRKEEESLYLPQTLRTSRKEEKRERTKISTNGERRQRTTIRRRGEGRQYRQREKSVSRGEVVQRGIERRSGKGRGRQRKRGRDREGNRGDATGVSTSGNRGLRKR